MKLHKRFFYFTFIFALITLLLIWLPEIVRLIDDPLLPYRTLRMVGVIILFGAVIGVFCQLRRHTIGSVRRGRPQHRQRLMPMGGRTSSSVFSGKMEMEGRYRREKFYRTDRKK